MSIENLEAIEPVAERELTEGERWLTLAGKAHLIGVETKYKNASGEPLTAERFPELCYDHVKPYFTILEKTEPSSELYQRAYSVITGAVDHYLGYLEVDQPQVAIE